MLHLSLYNNALRASHGVCVLLMLRMGFQGQLCDMLCRCGWGLYIYMHLLEMYSLELGWSHPWSRFMMLSGVLKAVNSPRGSVRQGVQRGWDRKGAGRLVRC